MIYPQMSVYLFVFLMYLFFQHSTERWATRLDAILTGALYERIKKTERVVGIYLAAYF